MCKLGRLIQDVVRSSFGSGFRKLLKSRESVIRLKLITFGIIIATCIGHGNCI